MEKKKLQIFQVSRKDKIIGSPWGDDGHVVATCLDGKVEAECSLGCINSRPQTMTPGDKSFGIRFTVPWSYFKRKGEDVYSSFYWDWGFELLVSMQDLKLKVIRSETWKINET